MAKKTPKKGKDAVQGVQSSVRNSVQAEQTNDKAQPRNDNAGKACAPISDLGARIRAAHEARRRIRAAKRGKSIKESRSTATDVQLEKTLVLLREGPQTTHSLRKYGVHHPAGRIFTLRAEGYDIHTERVRSVDSDGFTHIDTARYVLMKEPAPDSQEGGE